MSSVVLADLAEFQGQVDWPNYGSQAVIVRLCYGDLKVDAQADRNIEGARSKCQVRGWYCYLIAGRDPIAQANVFCKILQAHGGLQRNEFVVVDDEESSGGNELVRVNAFLNQCDRTLKTPHVSDQDWWYSGLNFAIAHNLESATGRKWVAAYGAGEPLIPHQLWQYTSSGQISGVAGNVDLSIFHGTVDDLIAVIGGTVVVSSSPGGNMSAIQIPAYSVSPGRVDAFIINPDNRCVCRLFTDGGAGGEDSLSADIKQWWIVGTVPTGGFEAGTLNGYLDASNRWVLWAINRTGFDRGQPYELVLRIDGGADQDWSPVGPVVALPAIRDGAYDDTAIKTRMGAIETVLSKIKAAFS